MAKHDAAEGSARWFIMAQLAESVHRASEAEAEAEIARKMRDDAIRRAVKAGISLVEVATLSGISKSRAQQIAPGELEGDQHAAALQEAVG